MHFGARFRSNRHAGALADLTTSFLDHFPELDAIEFELDLLPSSSRYLGLTDHDRTPPRIRLRAARPTNPTLTYTIPHELTHLLQRPVGAAPMGERSCDLYAMARAGTRFLVPPAYVRVPDAARDNWPRWNVSATALAREAIRSRVDGRRTYIAWWESSFRGLVRSLSAERDGQELRA
jgi:hypothetical protein